jgi:hypothetical protein
MEISMKETSKMIILMGKAFKFGLMEKSTREISKMELGKGKAF